ncbi:MAG: major facilitator superfamily 1 [Pedosphaera sp.]|nr:major facilitator superfamily 1 [Pedosphaera sp.]
MKQDTSSESAASKLVYPPGFRASRGLNWGFLGLLYTSFYMCRYNLPIANSSISAEFGFSRADMGMIITTSLLAYAFGQIINGLLTDRIGGKRAMLIGATGTIGMNILFGAASYWGVLHPELGNADHPAGQWMVSFNLFHTEIFFRLLMLFVAIRGVDGYMQAYGAPGMIKINTAWFSQRERGRFAGIFGFMINLGRFGIFNLGPALLAGFVFLGMWKVPPLHWRWLFWIPSGICAIVAVGMALTVRQTPEEAGFHNTHAAEAPPTAAEANKGFREVLLAIISHPTIWVVALAYACTGAVRQAVDQWFPRYMQDLYHMDMKSHQFQWLGFLIPFVASAGSLASGYISDTVFKGRRAPVAATLYFFETAIILVAAQFHTANAAIVFLVLISLTANSTHSILGTAAAMDIGGRKMAGFTSGIIDSFQYFGGSLAGYVLGNLLDKSLGNYFYFMAPFGVIGGILMLLIRGKVAPKPKSLPVTAPVTS